MDRVRPILESHRWLALAGLALISLTLGSVMFSGARFSSRSANSASLAAGSIQLSSTKPNQAIVSATGMKPGVSREGTISIGNEGDVDGALTLEASGLSGGALAAVLDLEVEDTTSGTTQKWSGKLDSLSSAGLGKLAPGETRKYLFTLSWPSGSTDPALQGASTSLTFKWSGVS